MKSRFPLVGLFAGVALVMLAAFALLRAYLPETSDITPRHPVPPGAHPNEAALRMTPEQWATLEVQSVKPASFPTVFVADAVVSVDEDATVPVFSPATGRVTAVQAQVGQFVARGQPLATIAGLETAQASADLTTALVQARTASEQLRLSRAVAQRQRGLVDAGGGATKDLLQSQSDLVAAEGADQTAAANLRAARIKAQSVGADGAAAPDAMVLAAPVAGEVIQRALADGQFVSSLAAGGAAPLFTISDLHRIWIIASIAEGDAKDVHVGQEVEVSTLLRAAKPVRARINWIAPTVDPTSRRIALRVELANLDLSLKPQMTARVRILDSRAAATLAIPSGAVIYDGDQPHCYVVSADRDLALRKLQVGRSEAGFTEVLSGLKAGERVVARGAIFVDALTDGSSS